MNEVEVNEVDNYIYRYIHCGRCLDDIPKGMSPRDYVNNEVGILPNGDIQVWCIRHEMNVVIFDIENHEMYVNVDEYEPECCPDCNEDTNING